MSTDTFISHVARHAGISNVDAERTTRFALSELGSYLTPSYRQLVAEELPPALGASLIDIAGVALPIEDRLLEPGVASVLRVLGEELSVRALLVLRAFVPPAIGRLLARPVRTRCRPVERTRIDCAV